MQPKFNKQFKIELKQWLSEKKPLNEIFIIAHRNNLKNQLIEFLYRQFTLGNLAYRHAGISTTEFKPDRAWLETLADNILNRLAQYLETLRGSTERDLESQIPISSD